MNYYKHNIFYTIISGNFAQTHTIKVMPRSGHKLSHGVAMCKYNKNTNGVPEVKILMVKRRYTYAYFSFVFGYYKKHNKKRIQHLFNNMTFGEKIDILSMNFSNMWYRLWLCEPEKNYDKYKQNTATEHQIKNLDYYFRKRKKFESIFLRDDGKLLRRLINNSKNASTPWEIPKGGANSNEQDLNCAVREFEEETGISPDKYTVLWNVNPIMSSHKDDNIIYKSNYYVAYLNNNNNNWSPKVNFNSAQQLAEVERVQWVSLAEINFLNLDDRCKKRLVTLYKNVITEFKNHVRSYYY